MSEVPYTAPAFKVDAFNCPHCWAYAQQKFSSVGSVQFRATHTPLAGCSYSECTNCVHFALWYEGKMVWPPVSLAPRAHKEMPEDCLQDFEEARAVLSVSPKSSAGLLRLVIQKLMVHLGQPGKNINDDIKALVAAGLPVRIQQALDACRIVGNEAVHPGSIDLTASPEIALTLFKLVNFIVDNQIAEPKAIDAMYSGLPADKLAGVKKRDGK